MSKVAGIEKYNKMVALHKENFAKRRDRINNDDIIDSLEKEHAALFRMCAANKISFDEYEKRSAEIENKKAERLVEMGESHDAMIYHPLCITCEDTGYYKGNVCSCLNKMIIESMYADSGINDILKKENFDTFDLKIFSDTPLKAGGKSPRNIIRGNRNILKRYVEAFDDTDDSYIFFGPTGTGKTFLTHCIAKSLLDKGKSVLFTSCHSMCTKLVDNQFGRRDDSEIYGYTSCDLLIIDELGLEVSNEYAQSQLYNVINDRQRLGKKTIITTNYTVESIKENYEERLVSRLSTYKFLGFYGDDIRIRKKKLASKN